MSQLKDGFKTLITLANAPAIKFYEKEVTPPTIEGGGPNDTTTMHNEEWRTKQPKALKTLGQMSVKAAYDTAVLPDIVANINVNQLITVEYPDGSSDAFWGWLDKWAPSALVEGEQPTADITFECSNQDDAGVETPPVYTEAP